MESFMNMNSEGNQNGNNSGYMILNSIKCGFYSEEISIGEWTGKLFVKLSQDFSNLNLLHEFYTWFVMMPTSKNGQHGGGFEAALYCLSKHSTLIDLVSLLIA